MDDKQIIEAIRKSSASRAMAMEYLYCHKKYQEAARKTYRKFYKLRLMDWRDILSQSIQRLVRMILENKVKEGKPLLNLFWGICNNVCRENLRNESKENSMPELELPPESVEDLQTPLEILLEKDQNNALQKVLDSISDRCQTILKLRALSYSSREIMQMMGYKNEAVVNATVKNCRMRLLEEIERNEYLRKILKDLGWL